MTDQPALKVGDKISGGRVSHFYAVVERIHTDHIVVRYNGDVRTVRIPNDLIERVR